jgi:hypothetical protein
VELYDPSLAEWTLSTSNTVGGTLGVLLPDGRALIVGSAASQIYDSSTRSWTPSVPLFSFGRPSALVSVGDGRALLLSSDSGTGTCTPDLILVSIFDSQSNAWTLTDARAAGYGPTMTMLPDGRALVAGLGGGCFSSGPRAALIVLDNVPPRLVAPATLQFGDVAIGATIERYVSLQNAGADPLNGSLVLRSGSAPGFTVVPSGPLSIAPHSTVDILVRFTASTFGLSSGSLDITSNGGTASVSLSADVGVSLSGRVTNVSGVGVPGVPIELHGSTSGITTTSDDGTYGFVVPPDSGSYLVVPAAPGLSFTPQSRTIVVGTTNTTGLNFTRNVLDPVAAFVSDFYLNVFERVPKPFEVGAWSDFIRANCNANAFTVIAHGFFDSQEFRTLRPVTLAGLVALLYRTMLGRDPELVGLADWVNVFRQERLRLAVQGFISSAEFQSLVPDRRDRAVVAGIVTRLYTEILGRAVKEGEVSAWTDHIVASGDLEGAAVAFLVSLEFETRPLTFRDYVVILYKAFLRRDPDPSGLEGWESILRTKLLTVLDGGFIPSLEFQGRVPQLCGG